MSVVTYVVVTSKYSKEPVFQAEFWLVLIERSAVSLVNVGQLGVGVMVEGNGERKYQLKLTVISN